MLGGGFESLLVVNRRALQRDGPAERIDTVNSATATLGSRVKPPSRKKPGGSKLGVGGCGAPATATAKKKCGPRV